MLHIEETAKTIKMNSLQKKLCKYPDFDVFRISPKRSKYCICIPVINEGEKIRNQLIQMRSIGKDLDIIIADGGSNDGSLDLEFLKNNNVSSLLIKRGPGKLGAQLRMVYYYAIFIEKYSGVITIDGNNKDDITGITSFVDKLDEGYDFIQGSRYLPGGNAINTPIIRYLAMRLIHVPLLSFISGFKYTDTTNGFRGYSSKLIKCEGLSIFRDIFNTYELLAYISTKAPKLGLRTIEVPVTRGYPKNGKIPTKISFINGNLLLLKILFYCCLSRYDP